MAIAPVLKTGVRKGMGVRIPRSPSLLLPHKLFSIEASALCSLAEPRWRKLSRACLYWTPNGWAKPNSESQKATRVLTLRSPNLIRMQKRRWRFPISPSPAKRLHRPALIDSIGLLAGAKSWNTNDQKKLEVWFDQFLTWMRESQNGREEASSQNNH